jgi:hypothetical protein
MSPRQHRRHATAVAAGIAASLMLVGCGSSSTPAAAPASTTTPVAPTSATTPAAPTPSSDAPSTGSAATTGGNACTLVTEQDVTAALGSDPGPGRPLTHLGASQCQYGSYQHAFVLVNLLPSQGQAAYDRMRNNPKLSAAGAVADVPGVGDHAFGISGHGQASIWINKGDSLLLVMVAIQAAPNPPKDQALALATAAASRL